MAALGPPVRPRLAALTAQRLLALGLRAPLLWLQQQGWRQSSCDVRAAHHRRQAHRFGAGFPGALLRRRTRARLPGAHRVGGHAHSGRVSAASGLGVRRRLRRQCHAQLRRQTGRGRAGIPAARCRQSRCAVLPSPRRCAGCARGPHLGVRARVGCCPRRAHDAARCCVLSVRCGPRRPAAVRLLRPLRCLAERFRSVGQQPRRCYGPHRAHDRDLVLRVLRAGRGALRCAPHHVAREPRHCRDLSGRGCGLRPGLHARRHALRRCDHCHHGGCGLHCCDRHGAVPGPVFRPQVQAAAGQAPPQALARPCQTGSSASS